MASWIRSAYQAEVWRSVEELIAQVYGSAKITYVIHQSVLPTSSRFAIILKMVT